MIEPERPDVISDDEWAARRAVVREALTWLRTPWHHAARVKGAGVDCGQFLAAVYEAAGVIPSLALGEYPSDWFLHRDDSRYLEVVERFGRKFPGPPLPGDAALYRFGRCIGHGAIVLEWPQIIHAYVPARMVTLDDAEANQRLVQRFAGFWSRWPVGA